MTVHFRCEVQEPLGSALTLDWEKLTKLERVYISTGQYANLIPDLKELAATYGQVEITKLTWEEMM